MTTRYEISFTWEDEDNQGEDWLIEQLVSLGADNIQSETIEDDEDDD